MPETNSEGLRFAVRQRPLIGTFLKLPEPDVVEVLSLAGFDFLVCDTEHAQLSEGDVRVVLLTARAVGLPVVVRVAELERGPINRYLEAGATGIQLARTRGGADADALWDLTHYPPSGSRSVSPTQPQARYGRIPLAEYLGLANAGVMLVGQYETAPEAGGGPIEVSPLLDVAFMGTTDLSVDLGVPGDVAAPAVTAHMAAVAAAAELAGVAMGGFAPTPSVAAEMIRSGYRYVVVGSDLGILLGAASRLREECRIHDIEEVR